MKKKAFIYLEIIISIFLFSLIIYILSPITSAFSKAYQKTKPTSALANHLRVIEFIEGFILSSKVETKNPLITQPLNEGIGVLKLNDIYLNNGFYNISSYILSENQEGDALYIEVPNITISNYIVLTNTFHLFRIKKIASSNFKIKQNLYYIKGESPGDRSSIIKFGKEELLSTGYFNSFFKEFVGGICFTFTREESGASQEFFLRREK